MTTIRQLQTSLPWTVHYHRDFRSNPQSHKDFGHALLHVFKAAGKLASLVNDAEHGGCEFTAEETDRYIADLVVCALRMANTCPGRTIDLEAAVVDRIAKKNAAEEAGEPQGAGVDIPYWLIERNIASTPEWFSSSPVGWVTDAMKAYRFGTQEAADHFVSTHKKSFDGFLVWTTEHLDIPAPPQLDRYEACKHMTHDIHGGSFQCAAPVTRNGLCKYHAAEGR